MKLAKITTVIVLFITASMSANAADTTSNGWIRSLIVDLTTTQTGYSDSWVGGEAGSFNWVSNLNGSAEKQLNPKLKLLSTLKISFGQTVVQDAETKEWGNFVKSTDLIDFENIGELTVGKFIDPYIAFRLETQFFDGRVDSMKQYFSPLKLTESAGIIHQFYKKDKQKLVSRFGFALRQIMKSVVDTVTFNVYDSTLTDGGIESVTDAVFQLSERMKYTGKLSLYKAFYFSKSDKVKGTPFEDDWKAIDINWENIVSAQVSKIVTVNLYTQLLYDKEVSKKGRFKETIAVGFIFNML